MLRAGFVRTPPASLPHDIDRLLDFVRLAPEFGDTYELLGDSWSRDIMISVLVFRMLGRERVKLAFNTPRFWSALRLVDTKLLRERASRDPKFLDAKLDFFDLSPIGLSVRLHTHPLGVVASFIVQQYRYQRNGMTIEVSPGDIVIEGGASWGDTTLYFADRVGENGKVISFEFAPVSTEILKENLTLNTKLAHRVTILSDALWDESGLTLSFNDNGPATSASLDAETNLKVRTITIDDMVAQQGLERVDFIKMDIEGSELRALMGAESTLRKHKPKLAISVYHKDVDLMAIPRYLNSLSVGYRFFLDHFTIHSSETVLFATT